MARPLAVSLPLCLSAIAAAVPAHAQRLHYVDVIEAPHRAVPRLSYAPGAPDEPEPLPAFYGDRLEWRPAAGADAYNWDVSAQLGGQGHRLWLSTTGDGAFGGPPEYLETQALYSRPLGSSGLLRDFVPRPRRSYAVAGVQGNVGEPLYVGAFGFLSHKGEFTARLFAFYDLDLPGNLVLQPAFEAEAAGADVPELGIGAGPVYVEAGLRLRYAFAEAFAPYVGVNWERLLGRTARFARDAGDEAGTTSLVIGIRSYFD
jgi:copper resistance protein B